MLSDVRKVKMLAGIGGKSEGTYAGEDLHGLEYNRAQNKNQG